MREKLKAAGIHLLAGLVLISLVFCLIYFVWYPAPFYQLSGGKDLLAAADLGGIQPEKVVA